MSFQSDAEIILEALNTYYEESLAREKPVIKQPPMGELIDDLGLAKHVEAGGLTGEKLATFVATYLDATTRVHHPANIAHQQAVPHYAAALAGLIDGLVSSDGSIYELGPAAVSIEYFLINWFLEKVGWEPAPVKPSEAGDGIYGGGILTHGGSLANLTALVAARSRVAPEVWHDGNPGDLALLAPAESHYSVARTAGIFGIGHKAIYPLEVDDRELIRPDRLSAAYERLVNDGKRAIALVANAANTAVGLYDPLQEIGEFCRERDLWLHVDGAHGGSALLTEKYRGLLKGVELADSFVVNAHKLMRTTSLCTILLVRDHRTLDNAFQQEEASYLFHEKDQPGYDFMHRTVECTKPVQGLKLFMVLAALGERGIGAYVERQFELAQEAHDYIDGLPDFECPVEPESNILCFRLVGGGEEQLALRDKLSAQGDFYVSSTQFRGERYLRLTLTNPESSMEDVRGVVKAIRHLAAED